MNVKFVQTWVEKIREELDKPINFNNHIRDYCDTILNEIKLEGKVSMDLSLCTQLGCCPACGVNEFFIDENKPTLIISGDGVKLLLDDYDGVIECSHCDAKFKFDENKYLVRC